MSVRHLAALQTINEGETDLATISAVLHMAVQDCYLHNEKPERDAAVLLLSTHLTMVTSCDRFISGKYRNLLRICENEVNRDISAIPTPEDLH